MPELGIITGLHAESRLIENAKKDGAAATVRTECAGADGSRALRLAKALVSEGADALMSFGIAGGLDPGLAPGDLVVPARICRADGPAVQCDTAWRERLLARIAGLSPKTADIAGSAHLITHPDAKRALRDRTGAGAVDMESLAVAEIAAGAGLPFIAVRAVADPAGRAPPLAVLNAIAEDGRVRPGMAVTAALRDPRLILLFGALARDNRAAMQSLSRVACRCGPLFGLI